MTIALLLDSAGFGEWFVLLAVVLIFVGPRNLPSAARKLGGWYAKFRRAAESFKRQIMDMETEMARAAEEAERETDEAFKVDEAAAAKAVPFAYSDDPTAPRAAASASPAAPESPKGTVLGDSEGTVPGESEKGTVPGERA